MNRIFARFLVLVLLAITLATGVIYATFSQLFGDPLDEIAQRQAAGQIFLLEQYIDQAPADEWLVRLNKVREVAAQDLELLPLPAVLAGLPQAKRAALLRGALVIDIAGKAFYRRVDLAGARYIDSDAEVIHAQRLPIDIGLALRMEAIRFAIIALFLLVPIGLWSRAHWRGLQALSRVADDFGQGRLDARAAVSRTSSIYPLAQRMNHMAGRIEGLMEARKTLLHSVSHELRTPIARLEFGLELLRKAAANDALEPRIGALEDDVGELNTLVSELLTLTQLDQPQALRRQPFELGALLRDCARALEPGLRGVRCGIEVGPELGLVSADRRLLARALNNLLGNAAKYARARIALSARRLDRHTVEIWVEDDGPGIPAHGRERVFEAFYRLEREQDHAVGGFGLGLAIALKALRLHGGDIAIGQSALGGAQLRLSLPCPRREAGAAPYPPLE